MMGYPHVNGFGGIMFTIVPIMVGLGFILVFGLIILKSIQGAKQWNRNNKSPVLTVDATVVTKRTDVNHHTNGAGANGMHHSSYSTTYYATFEVISGDRMEFKVSDMEYGQLVENDRGTLTFQGTRYLKFERSRS